MKRLFLRLFMLISGLALLVSCGASSHNADVSGDTETRIPLPQADGSYSLQVVQLLGLNNLYELNGQYAKFYMAPAIQNNRLTGSAPRGRFLKSGNLYVAADSLSLQLATVYAHMQNLAALDRDLGVGDLNKWPRDIGVSVRLSGGMLNNAFYDGDTDSMLFVPYSGKDLPLAVNAGILAHEHFHSLFYKIVTVALNEAGKNPGRVSLTAHSKEQFYGLMNMPYLRGDKTSDSSGTALQSSYHLMLFRGLNEGLADFWGWLYTGDPDFITPSLPTEKNYRSLRTLGVEDSMILSTGSTLRRTVAILSTDQKHLATNLVSYAYTLGTQYSRILKTFADTYVQDRKLQSEDGRKQVARLILKTLPLLRDDILNLKDTDYYEPSQFLMSFLSQVTDAKQDECNVMASVMNKNELDGNYIYSCEQKAGQSFWSVAKKEAPKDDSAKATSVVEPPSAGSVSFGR